MSKPKTTRRRSRRRPRILVLEGLHGAARCVYRAGGEPVVIDPRDRAAVERALKAPYDGLLLTGGGDVNPKLYGESPSKHVYGVNVTRDLTESAALTMAAATGIPVLGICRGSQLMAVHNGGRLRQHVRGHRGTEHAVRPQPGTTFAATIGEPLLATVSLHHQAVLRHGPGWRVAARDATGMIEAVESKDGRCLGVQFHPEMDYGRNPGSRRIFRWLTCESANRAGLAKPKTRTLLEPTYAPQLPARRPHRQAGDRTSPNRGAALRSSWICCHCGMLFDELHDRDDHEAFVHEGGPLPRLERAARTRAHVGRGADGERLVGGRATEPPAGHPDWEN